MQLIPTLSKEKLPKGFAYPISATALPIAFEGIWQFDDVTEELATVPVLLPQVLSAGPDIRDINWLEDQ